MGIYLKYQGLPPRCGFIELVRSRTWSEPSWVGAVSHWLRWGVGGKGIKPGRGQPFLFPDEPEAELVWAWCCEAVERFPDLQERTLDVGKSYRWLPFLLSAKARKQLRGPESPPTDPRAWNDPESPCDDVVEQAFQSAPPIAPGVRATQGVPIRLIERKLANDISVCVACIERAEVEPRISELIELGEIAAWDAERTMQTFCEFQQFFAEAAERGEDVLAIWD